jgi:hypothetical protein
LIAAPRLKRLGIEVPDSDAEYPREYALYALLQKTQGDNAHSRYNALIRRIVSFARCLEREAGQKIREAKEYCVSLKSHKRA